MKLVRTLINGWLVAVAIDGVARMVSGLLQALFGIPPLAVLILPFDLLALFGGVVAWFAAAVSPKIPKRVLVPPMIALVWMLAGAMPFSVIWFNRPGMQLSIGLTVLLSAGVAEALARTAGHGSWFVNELSEGTAFDGWSAARWVGGWGLLTPIALVLYGVFGSAWALSYSTHGFLTMTTEGIAASHKVYESEGDTVELIAMIHLGEQAGYQRLFAEIPRDGTLVLTEGVRDSEHKLSAPQDAYQRAANAVGLTVQRPIDELADLETRNADVDVNTFSDTTIELLNVALGMYALDEDPEGALTAYLGFWQEHRTDAQQVTEQMWEDILESRNRYVLAELETERADYDRIVLPWGALHMVGISAQLEEDGWTWVHTDKVVLIRWSTVFGR